MIDFLLLIIIIPFAYSIWVGIGAVVLYRIDKRLYQEVNPLALIVACSIWPIPAILCLYRFRKSKP